MSNQKAYEAFTKYMNQKPSEEQLAALLAKQVSGAEANVAKREVQILNILGEIAEMGGQYLGEAILVQQTHRVKDNEGKNFQVRRLTEKQLETVIRDIVRANNIRLA